MKIRPKIEVGDVVKLSKRAKIYDIPKNATMIVKSVEGDGIDKSSNISVLYDKVIYTFKRTAFWKTGFNTNKKDKILPANNNGRDSCFMCNKKTKTIVLFTSTQQICVNSMCRWFEN